VGPTPKAGTARRKERTGDHFYRKRERRKRMLYRNYPLGGSDGEGGGKSLEKEKTEREGWARTTRGGLKD